MLNRAVTPGVWCRSGPDNGSSICVILSVLIKPQFYDKLLHGGLTCSLWHSWMKLKSNKYQGKITFNIKRILNREWLKCSDLHLSIFYSIYPQSFLGLRRLKCSEACKALLNLLGLCSGLWCFLPPSPPLGRSDDPVSTLPYHYNSLV